MPSGQAHRHVPVAFRAEGKGLPDRVVVPGFTGGGIDGAEGVRQAVPGEVAEGAHAVGEDLEIFSHEQGHGILAGKRAEAPAVIAVGAAFGGLGGGPAIGPGGGRFGKGRHGTAVVVEVEAAGPARVGRGHEGPVADRFEPFGLGDGEESVGKALAVPACRIAFPVAGGTGHVVGDFVEQQDIRPASLDLCGQAFQARVVRAAKVLRSHVFQVERGHTHGDATGHLRRGGTAGQGKGQQQGGGEQAQHGETGRGGHTGFG